MSLSSRPCLDELLPSISDCIALEADADVADVADMADGSPDNFLQYQHQIKGTDIHLCRRLDAKINFSVAEALSCR